MFPVSINSLLLCVLMGLAGGGWAAEQPWRFSGFASQGLSNTSDNRYFGKSDDRLSFDFFEAGLLAERDWGEHLSLSGKLAYRAPYAIQAEHLSVDHLLLDYLAVERTHWYAGLRLGRVKLGEGLYGSSRDTSYTWPTALMNDIIYSNKLLPLYLATDGINLYAQRDFSRWSAALELTSGRSQVPGSAVEDQLFYSLIPAQTTHTDKLINSRLELSNPGSGSRLVFTWLYLETEFDISFEGLVRTITPVHIRQLSLSFSQQWRSWRIDVEAVQGSNTVFASQARVEPLSGPRVCAIDCSQLTEILSAEDRPSGKRGGYNLSLHYLYPGGLDLYLSVGEHWDNNQDKHGDAFEAGTGLPGHIKYSASYGLGFIYPLASHWDIAAELRYNEGTSALMFVDNPVLSEHLSKHWMQTFLRLTYHF